MNGTDVSVKLVFPIVKAISVKGYDPDDFLREVSFDAAVLEDPEARMDGNELVRLTAAAAAYTGDDHFGLHQGQLMEFADLGILGYVMQHSATIEAALGAYRRYNAIVSSGFQLEVSIRGDEAAIRVLMQSGGGELSRHCVEDMTGSLYRLMGRLSSRSIPLRGVEFAHPAPAETAAYVEVFGRVPVFGGTGNVLRIHREALAYPILYADPALLAVFEDMAKRSGRVEGEVGDVGGGGDGGDGDRGSLADSVAQWLRERLPASFPTVQQTAEAFGMSARSLQMKLKEELTSFNALSVEVRKELAMGYLGKPELSVGEVAYALHFSEPSAFQNAFKKWTGGTPGQYRESVRRESGAGVGSGRGGLV